MLKSIRSRLALSFAGIALVAAIVLGAVLLTILQSYYSNLELDYLRGNAKFMSALVTTMTSDNASHDEMQSQIENLAFLTQTRIRFYEGNRQVLYDSGSPEKIGVNLGGVRQLFAAQANGGPGTDVIRMIAVNKRPDAKAQPSEATQLPSSAMLGNKNIVFNVSVKAAGSPFGFDLNSETSSGDARSNQVVKQTVLDPTNGDVLGTVELSEGPAYGRAILASVAIGWALAALRRFVSDAAHELHTPLTALRTNLDLATDEPDAQAHGEYIRRAQGMVRRLEGLTNDLLDLSRIQSTMERCQTFDLVELLAARTEVYASQAEQAGLTFLADLPAEPARVCADPAHVLRSVDNLIDNACKFTPPGGTVTERLSQRAGQVVVSVSDTGIGIPAQDLPQLFQRFHRGRNATALPGSGLGLAIVKAIVEQQGGNVTAENLSTGARFTLTWPSVA